MGKGLKNIFERMFFPGTEEEDRFIEKTRSCNECMLTLNGMCRRTFYHPKMVIIPLKVIQSPMNVKP
jgi:hypothetical protein